MSNIRKPFILTTLAASLFSSSIAFAQGDVHVKIDGNEFNAVKQIIDGKTYVSIDAFAKLVNAPYSLDPEKKSVTINEKSIEVQNIEGTLTGHITKLAEAAGLDNPQWDGASKTVVLSTKLGEENAYKAAVAELAKASEGKSVDYDKVAALYTKELQPLVKKRDAEKNESYDQQITAALEAGQKGELEGVIVKQIFDKLMQREFFYTIRHEFAEIAENWGNQEEVQEELEEAKEFYSIIKSTVDKRDAAYKTNLADTIQAGFNQIESAIQSSNSLEFQLGKQVVDKTLMKVFYLAAGALENGYASKVAATAPTDAAKAKIQQTEGWAFYQSIKGYVAGSAKEEAEYIESQFSLNNEVGNVNADETNKAFIRGFAKVALHEYEESVENWGKDKSVITALEGALFIDMIDRDIKRVLGEESLASLNASAEQYLAEVKQNDKEKALKTLKSIEETLNALIEKAK